MDKTEFLKQFAEIEQEIVPPELRAKGWRYVDFPTKFSFQAWDYLLRLLGEGEYQILIMSKGEDWIRGQFLISPQGQKNMVDKDRRESIKF